MDTTRADITAHVQGDQMQRGRWGRVAVAGDSMRPTLRAGDWLVVQWGRTPAPGEVVVVRRGDLLMVKRAARHGPAGWWVLGDDPSASGDSRVFGSIPDEDVLGVVRWRYWPRPVRLVR